MLPVDKHISVKAGYAIGAILEMIYKVLGKQDEPRMTRFVARQLATAHWYDISAAKNDLAYAPSVTMDEGMKRLANWFAEQNRENG